MQKRITNGHSADEAVIADLTLTAKATRGKKPKEADDAVTIEIPALKLGMMTLTLNGTSPLIMHRFADKSIRQMADKQQGAARQAKAPKNPTADFLASLHTTDGVLPASYKDKAGQTRARCKKGATFCFPASAFKKAAVYAADQCGLKATQVNKTFHVLGRVVEIQGEDPVMTEDPVRIGGINKVADLRYRGYFHEWSCKLTVRYNMNVITPSQLANLFNNAGFCVGIGDWRVQKQGSNGMFEVDSSGANLRS